MIIDSEQDRSSLVVEVKLLTVLCRLLSLPQSCFFHLLGGGITCLALQGCLHRWLEEMLEQQIVLYLFILVYFCFLYEAVIITFLTLSCLLIFSSLAICSSKCLQISFQALSDHKVML